MARRALVVGIDRYPGFAAPHSRLRGAVNDARLMSALLADRFGFDDGTTLLDAEATRAALLGALDDLAGRVQADDEVAIFFSGHGSQRPDLDGDEADGFDETLVPHDSGRGEHPDRDLVDDELYRRLVRMAAVTERLTVIVDACTAGTVSRAGVATQRWAPRGAGNGTAAGTVSAERLAEIRRRRRRRTAAGVPWLPPDERWVLLTACHDDEGANELTEENGLPTAHGAFTWYLARELERSGPGTTYRELLPRVAAGVGVCCPGQHPVIAGGRDRVLFGGGWRRPRPYVLVSARDGARATLAAGAAAGLMPGARWDVLTPAVGAGEQRPLGRLTVERVGAVAAEATVTEETGPGAVTAGCRAVEADPGAAARLTVEPVDGGGAAAAIAALRRRLAKSGWVSVAPEGGGGRLRVWALPAREAVREGDPLPALGPLAEPVWVAVGPDGAPALPLLPLSHRRSLAALVTNLETHARYLRVLELADPDPGSPLAGQLSVELLRCPPGEEWQPASPAEVAGVPLFAAGDRVALHLRNEWSAALHLAVFDLGLTGRVEQLHPEPGGAEPLAAGRVLRLGEPPRPGLTLRLPEGFPFAPGKGPVEGTGFFKVIATERATDLSHLEQPPYLLAPGSVRREGAPPAPPAGLWTCLTLPLRLRRP